MKDEKGITLIELLVAVVIAGIVIVPLLTIMTGTFTRTASQGKETQLMYFAQEVMENVRRDGYDSSQTMYYCSESSGCDLSDDVDDVAEVTVSKIDRDFSGSTFYEVAVTASSRDVVAENVELVTVVKP